VFYTFDVDAEVLLSKTIPKVPSVKRRPMPASPNVTKYGAKESIIFE
jgi:hypothetical protein